MKGRSRLSRTSRPWSAGSARRWELAVADREPWTPALAAGLAADGLALTRLGEKEQARAELDRAVRLAAEHGLPHVLRDAREARRQL